MSGFFLFCFLKLNVTSPTLFFCIFIFQRVSQGFFAQLRVLASKNLYPSGAFSEREILCRRVLHRLRSQRKLHRTIPIFLFLRLDLSILLVHIRNHKLCISHLEHPASISWVTTLSCSGFGKFQFSSNHLPKYHGNHQFPHPSTRWWW